MARVARVLLVATVTKEHNRFFLQVLPAVEVAGRVVKAAARDATVVRAVVLVR